MSDEPPSQPPQISPDGKFYFDGSRWAPFTQPADQPHPSPGRSPGRSPGTGTERGADQVGGVTNSFFNSGYAVTALVGIPVMLVMVPVSVQLLFNPGTRLTGCLLLIGPAIIGWRIWSYAQASRRN